MECIESLNKLGDKILDTFYYASHYNSFLSSQQNLNINKITKEIQSQFEVDYYKKIKISSYEKKRLEQLLIDYIKNQKDCFNSHYIQLLAWYIDEIKVINVKRKQEIKRLSVFEYSPNPLIPIAITNKVFLLFSKRRISPEKIAPALLISYLNNYKNASVRYKNLLKHYLKVIKYSKLPDLYFNPSGASITLLMKTSSFPNMDTKGRLEYLNVNKNEIHTKYFKDVFGV